MQQTNRPFAWLKLLPCSFPQIVPHRPLCYIGPGGTMSGAERKLQRDKRALFAELGREIGDRRVLRVMEGLPRELFVPADVRPMAYRNIPLAIGAGQTISQPYIVARMTELLELRGGERVLEVGTGSGYQAAVLSRLLPRGRLVTVEREPELAARARALLSDLGCGNVTAELAGPELGAPAYAPFDAIIVTAAGPRLPSGLVAQLAVGGRLLAPVGTREEQDLTLARRTDEGLSVGMLGKCRFVPLLGSEGFGEG